jgi:FKBP-type peptidyl-prolyl cis-trans isomerase
MTRPSIRRSLHRKPTGGIVRHALVLTLGLAAAWSVLGATAAEPNGAEQDGAETAEQPWVELKNGLRYVDLELGAGKEATPGRTVQVHYTGWLADGTRFQSSRDSGKTFVFVLGRGQVIAGWDKGVVGMKPGGRRKLEIPAKMAYGKRGRPGIIPPNSMLIFEIELLSVQ